MNCYGNHVMQQTAVPTITPTTGPTPITPSVSIASDSAPTVTPATVSGATPDKTGTPTSQQLPQQQFDHHYHQQQSVDHLVMETLGRDSVYACVRNRNCTCHIRINAKDWTES